MLLYIPREIKLLFIPPKRDEKQSTKKKSSKYKRILYVSIAT